MDDEATTAPSEEELDAVILEYLEESEAGRNPDPEKFASRHPYFASGLRAFLDDQAFVNGWVSRTDEVPTPNQHDQATRTEVKAKPVETLPLLPGFRVIECIGRGGMGAVYKARDERLHRDVAVKQMLPEVASRPNYRERFLREARALAALDHPHVVPVLSVGEVDDQPFFVMPLLKGESLSDRLSKGGPMSASELRRLAEELASGLGAIHPVGLIHRDLKPSNVWLEDAKAGHTPGVGGWGQARILDFGLAKVSGEPGSELTAIGAVMGTVAYMSPEQAAGNEVTVRSDLFALGCLLYRAATGETPFGNDDYVKIVHRIATETPASPAERNSDIPASLSGLIMRLLEKDAEKRPASADEVASFLRTGAEVGDIRTWPDGESGSSERNRRWLWGTAAAVLLVGVAVPTAVWMTRDGREPRITQSTPQLPPIVSRLVVEPLEVIHFENLGDGDGKNRGRIGDESKQVKWEDAVQIRVKLNEPAYFYLIGYNFDGREQLLYPAKGERPQRRQGLLYPGGDDQFYLNDDALGGEQAFVVAASSKPLPTWEEWKAQASPGSWSHHEPMDGVWASDGQDTFVVDIEQGIDRGTPGKGLSTPPLTALCKTLRGNGVEVVEALAFPVWPKGD